MANMNQLYTPRSGAFRKVKYALKIYREEEFPRRDFKNLQTIAQKIREDAEMLNHEERWMIGAKKSSGNQQNTGQSEVYELSASRMQKENFDESDNARVPDDVYDKLYPPNVQMPNFPIKSYAGKESSRGSNFNNDDLSDYDMDSEDEEWLEKHPEYKITPNRLEYIFTQLNKRNTHVPGKAIGVLRPPYRGDFHKVFPYWKEKRLYNKNVSTFKPKINCPKRESKNFEKDPFLVFLSNPEKVCPNSEHPPRKMTRSSEADGLCSEKLEQIKKALEYFKLIRESAIQEIKKGEGLRHKIFKGLTEFDERYQNIMKSNHDDHPDGPEPDHNNNTNIENESFERDTSSSLDSDKFESSSCSDAPLSGATIEPSTDISRKNAFRQKNPSPSHDLLVKAGQLSTDSVERLAGVKRRRINFLPPVLLNPFKSCTRLSDINSSSNRIQTGAGNAECKRFSSRLDRRDSLNEIAGKGMKISASLSQRRKEPSKA